MNRGSTIHPKMVPGLVSAGFFPHVCAIQQRSDVQTVTGSPRPSWATRPGLEAVPCRRSITSIGGGGQETRTSEIVAVEKNEYQIILAGYFPEITAKDSALWEDGVTRYDIEIANHDSASVMTWLSVRVVQPIADQGV